MRRIWAIILCAVLVFSIPTTVASASESTVMPRYNGFLDGSCTFTINQNVCSVFLEYTCNKGYVQEAIVTTKLEKQVFWFFWEREYEWIDASIEDVDSFTHTYGVSSGTYRITVTFEITGTDGTTDTITEQREASC